MSIFNKCIKIIGHIIVVHIVYGMQLMKTNTLYFFDHIPKTICTIIMCCISQESHRLTPLKTSICRKVT